jgi:hypothetical protein
VTKNFRTRRLIRHAKNQNPLKEKRGEKNWGLFCRPSNSVAKYITVENAV